jgi:hypothetical protein
MPNHQQQGWSSPQPQPSARPVSRLIAGVNSASDSGKDCGAQQVCQDANDVGTAIGAGLVIFLWAAGAVILGVIWLVTNSRSASREPRERPPSSW